MINRNRLIDLFCDLAVIKSPSGREAEIAAVLVEKMQQLSLFSQRDGYGNMVVKVPGVGDPLVLCAHLDTVPIGPGAEIKPIVDGRIIKSDGTTILGADNKDYIAAIIEALTVILENRTDHRPLEIVFTKEEEAISKGAENLDFSLLQGKECIISDSSDPFGTITLSAPFYVKFEIIVHGKRTHVKNIEKGIDAIKAAALLISSMPLGRVDQFVTVNIAFIAGGIEGIIDKITLEEISKQSCNNIPDLVRFVGEVRGRKEQKVEEIFSEIQKSCDIVAEKIRAEIQFNFKRLAIGYSYSPEEPLIQKIVAVFKTQGVDPSFIHAIGGSDANNFIAHGVKAVVISSAHRNNHELSEFLIIDDLVRLTDFLLRFITCQTS